jgi:hypothetical protein
MTRIISAPDLSTLSAAELARMQAAGREVAECHRVLAKGGLNVVGEVLKGQGQFFKLNHYPKGDVYDKETHAQYYYHAHRDGEHGHFHCFLRAKGMPPGVTPAPEAAQRDWPRGDQALAHIVAISMDKQGFPLRMFTTNRWVTGETWYPAGDVLRMLDLFAIDHANPSWPTNRWITAMLRLFRPQVMALIEARDVVFAERAAAHPDRDTFDDRAFETITEIAIDIDTQIAAVEQAAKVSPTV